jgi:hypothetical protein
MLTCPKIGQCRAPDVGRRSSSQLVLQEVKKIIHKPNSSQRFPGIPSSSIWIPVTDKHLNGTWKDFYTDTKVVSTDFIATPSRSAGSNCAILVVPWGGWSEWVCHSDLILCACQYLARPYLTLRGLCKKTNVDTIYVPKNDPADGQLTFYGLKNSVIKFEDNSWKIKVIGIEEKTTAVTNSSKQSFLLGKHSWTITDDAKECNGGIPYKTSLKLSGCNAGQFTCHDGQCVAMYQRCDKVGHCRDQSDEEGCRTLVIGDRYDRNVAPFGSNANSIEPIDVNISVVLIDIENIDEEKNEFKVKYMVSLEWYENRVTFHNLKTSMKMNVLTEDDVERLWIPKIIFENTKTSSNDEAVGTLIAVTREGQFKRSEYDILDEIEIFTGKENKLTKNQTRNDVFSCKFDLRNYPFDTQVLFS